MISKGMGWDGVDSTRLAEYEDTWWALVNTAMNVGLP